MSIIQIHNQTTRYGWPLLVWWVGVKKSKLLEINWNTFQFRIFGNLTQHNLFCVFFSKFFFEIEHCFLIKHCWGRSAASVSTCFNNGATKQPRTWMTLQYLHHTCNPWSLSLPGQPCLQNLQIKINKEWIPLKHFPKRSVTWEHNYWVTNGKRYNCQLTEKHMYNNIITYHQMRL